MRGTPTSIRRALDRLHPARLGARRDERVPHRGRAVRRYVQHAARAAHLARVERPRDHTRDPGLGVPARRHRLEAERREHRRGPGALDADGGVRGTRIAELDVVRDEELLQRLQHRRAGADVHVEQQDVRRREHPDVRGDAPWIVRRSPCASRPGASVATSQVSMPWRKLARSGPLARTRVRNPRSTAAQPPSAPRTRGADP
jgi:hypothetical protein